MKDLVIGAGEVSSHGDHRQESNAVSPARDPRRSMLAKEAGISTVLARSFTKPLRGRLATHKTFDFAVGIDRSTAPRLQ